MSCPKYRINKNKDTICIIIKILFYLWIQFVSHIMTNTSYINKSGYKPQGLVYTGSSSRSQLLRGPLAQHSHQKKTPLFEQRDSLTHKYHFMQNESNKNPELIPSECIGCSYSVQCPYRGNRHTCPLFRVRARVKLQKGSQILYYCGFRGEMKLFLTRTQATFHKICFN